MREMTEEEKQAEAASWRAWQNEWGNTESGAHAFGWINGYDHARTAGGDAGEVARLKELAEYARSQALLLNHGCDDYALQDAILEALSQILGPLPGDAALAPTGGDGSGETEEG
jgi:hypothetical protein